MAEDESRVYKASEVHKRRAPKKARPGAKPAGRVAGKPVMRTVEQPAKQPVEEPAGQTVEGPAAGAGEAEARPAAVPAPSDAPEAAAPEVAAQETAPEAPAPESVAPEAVAPEAAEAPEKDEAPDRKRWGVRIAVAVACVAVAALLVSAGFLAGSRWLRFNDAHDIEGTWYVSGTDVPVAFDDGFIVLDSSTSYAYEIDATAKTIAYSLGNLEGRGRYWFNDGRDVLVITDGADYTMWSTWLDDLAYGASRLFGNEELPAGDGSIVLSKSITLPSEAPAEPEDAGGPDAGERQDREGEAAGEQPDEDGKAGGFGDLPVSDVPMRESGQDDAW